MALFGTVGMPDHQALIEVARGLAPADILLTNGQIVDVHSGQVHRADIAVLGDTIAGIGSGYEALQVLDLRGRFLLPGLIDGRANIEAAFATLGDYGRIALSHGTTAIVVELADTASVSGLRGVSELLDGVRVSGIDVFFSVPHIQIDESIETSGSVLDQQALLVLDQVPHRVGYGGYLDSAALVQGRDHLSTMLRGGALPLTGSGPALLAKDLMAYIAVGVSGDDHWLSEEEAQQKLESGLWLLAQESSTVSGTSQLPSSVKRGDSHRCCLVTGRRTPGDMLSQGHLDYVMRTAVRHGMSSVQTVRCATLNPATYYHLVQRGAVAPGYIADLVAVDDLVRFQIEIVLKSGKVVAHRGQPLSRASRQRVTFGASSVKMKPMRVQDLAIRGHSGFCRVIGLRGEDAFTDAKWELTKVQHGLLIADPERDILKAVVVERHRSSGRIGLGFVHGTGLTRGAFCTSVAPPAHPLVAVGCNDDDILVAISRVADMQGGMALVVGGKVIESLPLPIAGLVSTATIEDTAERLDRLESACWDVGCALGHPASSIGALANLHLPALRLSERGVVDTDEGSVVALQDDH